MIIKKYDELTQFLLERKGAKVRYSELENCLDLKEVELDAMYELMAEAKRFTILKGEENNEKTLMVSKYMGIADVLMKNGGWGNAFDRFNEENSSKRKMELQWQNAEYQSWIAAVQSYKSSRVLSIIAIVISIFALYEQFR